MLVITFGRAASQELRERVREQLVAAERALADPASVDPSDALLTHLASADVPQRRKRITDALAGFDGATIATTHQFCQLVLRSLGVAGDTDSRAELVESLDDLVVEVTDDLYLRGSGRRAERAAVRSGRRPPAGPGRGRRPAGGAGPARRRAGHRRGRSGSDFALRRPARGRTPQAPPRRPLLRRPAEPARRRARGRRRTRPGSGCGSAGRWCWSTSSRTPTPCSGTSSTVRSATHATLVLIGDPKQAIYAFRGGDVVTYLRAAGTATHPAHPRHQLAQRRRRWSTRSRC